MKMMAHRQLRRTSLAGVALGGLLERGDTGATSTFDIMKDDPKAGRRRGATPRHAPGSATTAVLHRTPD